MGNVKMDSRGQVSDLFRVVSRVVKRVDIDDLINLISTLDKDSILLDEMDDVVDYILDCVVEEFSGCSVTKDKLFNKTKKGRGYTKIALNMAMVIIRINLKVSDEQVSKYFNRVRQVSFRAMKEFKTLNPKFPEDVRYMERYERIDKKVKIFIEELNKK